MKYNLAFIFLCLDMIVDKVFLLWKSESFPHKGEFFIRIFSDDETMEGYVSEHNLKASLYLSHYID